MTTEATILAAWSAAAWSAIAAWLTALVALAAGAIALRQVQEARRLREEQAQPYVVAFMESGRADPRFVDLVVRNFGKTSAYNVSMTIQPTPKRSTNGPETADVWIFEQLPVLVPGQDWRTLWDFGPDRSTSGLPDRHQAVVAFSDSQGHQLPELESVLDWEVYKGRQWVTTYGTHEVAKALREMSKTMRRWRESVPGGLE